MPLHLIPNLLQSDCKPSETFVPHLYEVVNSCDGFFVEDPKEARLFLKHFDFELLRKKPMELLNKNGVVTKELLAPLLKGENWAVISDSGLPCIADPGALLVEAARARGIEVKAYVGPFSILMALMLFGFSGQRFIFQGYMPRTIDKKIRLPGITQIFIETPYNNHKTLERLLQILPKSDRICLAVDLMLPTEEVFVYKVGEWKERLSRYDFHKRPAVFLLSAD